VCSRSCTVPSTWRRADIGVPSIAGSARCRRPAGSVSRRFGAGREAEIEQPILAAARTMLQMVAALTPLAQRVAGSAGRCGSWRRGPGFDACFTRPGRRWCALCRLETSRRSPAAGAALNVLDVQSQQLILAQRAPNSMAKCNSSACHECLPIGDREQMWTWPR